MAIAGKVALLGANGAVGRTLGPLLSAHGHSYRVVGRSLLGLQVRFHEDPLCEHFQWDPEDEASIAEACAGAGTVIYLVGVALWKFKDHLPLIQKTLRASKEAGVQRFLLVSSNWSYSRVLGTGRINEDYSRESPAIKGRLRREQEDLVLAAHTQGSFATGVLRISDMYGPRIEASHLWSIFQAAKRGTEAQVLGPIDRPHEFVFVPDAAATIERLLEADSAWQGASAQRWNLAGAGTTTIQEMAELIFRTEGKLAKYKVPGRLLMRFVRAMNPYIREMGEMQYLLETSVLLDDARLQATIGPIERTPYAQGVQQTLVAR